MPFTHSLIAMHCAFEVITLVLPRFIIQLIYFENVIDFTKYVCKWHLVATKPILCTHPNLANVPSRCPRCRGGSTRPKAWPRPRRRAGCSTTDCAGPTDFRSNSSVPYGNPHRPGREFRQVRVDP